jgi:ankyrin repeat protein
MYVEHGAYPDHTEKDGFTAGTLAASNGHWNVVEYLVRSGANFRIPDATGRTVVNYAVESEKQDVLELLHAKPTPLAQWKIEAKNFPLRGSDSERYNRAYRILYRMAGEQWGETAVTWFQALVEEEGGQETIVSGLIDLRFAPDGNSLTVTYADGRVEKLLM